MFILDDLNSALLKDLCGINICTLRAWDETRLLNGYPGEYCHMARRSGKKWYVAGISARQQEQISLDLKSIVKTRQQVTVYIDKPGPQDAITTKTMTISPSKPLTLSLKENGGFAFIIEEK